MTPLNFILKSLRHHRRTHVAVVLGVAVATAVLTGALLVGDSVRGSLRHLALDRLGQYDEVLVTNRFFRSALSDEIAATPGFHDSFTAAVPAMLLRGTLEHIGPSRTQRAGGVMVIGCPAPFWQHGPAGQVVPKLGPGQIVINAELAAAGQLDVHAGDELMLRIGQVSQIPADSPLGRRSETTRSRALTVSGVIPSEGLGRFGLHPSQQVPLCAFVDLATLQEMLDALHQVNAILLAGRFDAATQPSSQWITRSQEAHGWIADHLRPTLADYGLSVKHVVIGDPQRPVNEYYNLTGDRMLLDSAVLDAAAKAWPQRSVEPALTYLANNLEANGREVPYSTITAIDNASATSPLKSADGAALGPLKDDEIVLTDWAADDLKAKPGDEIRVAYFDPETTHGKVTERTAALRLKAIVPLSAAKEPPRRANDPDLTPELKGVTDKAAIADWNPPFPFDGRRIRPRDEQYWKDHRTTPKAYVSLATGRKLWGNRFGNTTSLRVAPAPGVTEASLSAALLKELKPAVLSFEFRPVKQLALSAAAGTTPFDVLFLAMSMFLIAASVMLLAILFRLGIEQRAAEIGLLLAVGLSRRLVARLLVIEATVLSVVGALLGVLGGVFYAWLLLVGLRTWWLGAIGTPFLRLYVTPGSLLIGCGAGVLIGAATVLLSLRQLRRIPARQLLSGTAAAPFVAQQRGVRVVRWLGLVLLSGALALTFMSSLAEAHSNAQLAAGLFFAGGATTLAALLALVWGALRSPGSSRGRGLTFAGLAWRNAARNPGRSALTIGLTASACFLIVAVSAFRVDVPAATADGFNLLAESSVPVHHDLATRAGRDELSIVGSEARELAYCRFAALRVHDGDDASCLNLYRPRQPRILGVPKKATGWPAQHDAIPRMLELAPPTADGQPRVGVVLDENTARYSLNLWGGVGDTLTVRDQRGREVPLVVVGLLKNSIFQGDLLIDEEDFLKLYPDTEGYRLFLIDAPPERVGAVSDILESRLGDYGFDATTVRDRLAALMAVQNTYLSTFQSLGALGLLLGTFGLAAVQLRSVLERRGELALLRAAGFRRRRIAMLVLCENGVLLLAGLASGVAAALVAVWPHLFGGEAHIPWAWLGTTLGAVAVAGLAAGFLAVRATLQAPLLAALRGE